MLKTSNNLFIQVTNAAFFFLKHSEIDQASSNVELPEGLFSQEQKQKVSEAIEAIKSTDQDKLLSIVTKIAWALQSLLSKDISAKETSLKLK